jgi:transposase
MTNRTFKSGESREQPSLLPPRIEDYVGAANPVRAIDSFVCALDLAKLGFRHAERRVGVGQPPYDPSDLLKLYLYGYLNQIRSSRRLEREACRNLELIWLLKNLQPGYRTIANFRKENWAALKAANRSFVLLRVRIEGQWWDVPDEALIKEPNRAGRTMVWPVYYRELDRSLRVEIRCFMPGSMT